MKIKERKTTLIDGVPHYPITKKEWDNTHKNYKGIRNGRKYKILNINGITMSCPVIIKENR